MQQYVKLYQKILPYPSPPNSNISSQASEDLEDRESLAQIAASQNEQNTSDGETYIEKYIRGVSAVESILTLDRLRQVGQISWFASMGCSGPSLKGRLLYVSSPETTLICVFSKYKEFILMLHSSQKTPHEHRIIWVSILLGCVCVLYNKCIMMVYP